jgi:hypothetical protein
MVQVTINLDPKLLTEVDEAALEHELSRSRFIAECIRSYFSPKEALTNEGLLLTKDLEHIKELMAMREAEIADLKELNGRLWQEWHEANTRLLQYQLPPPKPRAGFWSRFRRKKGEKGAD